MAVEPVEIMKQLNPLIETCKDGEQGYRTAAKVVATSELKQLLESFANRRELFATELQAEVERLGGAPQRGGSITGTLHCGWLNLVSLVAGMDERAIFAVCENGDGAAVKAYEKALKADLPPETRSIVERQFNHIKEAYERVHALELVAAKAC
jgi:uncharacterized protein (TIGR02284 family)